VLQLKQVLVQLAQCRRATAVAGADASTVRTPRRAASARAGTGEEAVTPKRTVASAHGDASGTEMAHISSPASARPRYPSAASTLVRASVIPTPSRMQF
jgi:hypothetical protein